MNINVNLSVNLQADVCSSPFLWRPAQSGGVHESTTLCFMISSNKDGECFRGLTTPAPVGPVQLLMELKRNELRVVADFDSADNSFGDFTLAMLIRLLASG